MSRVSRFAAGLAVAALSLVWLGGCAGTPSYVNLPPERGDVASHDANAANVREAETAAIQAVLLDQPIQGRFRVMLPDGTTAKTYATITQAIGQRAVPAVMAVATTQPAATQPSTQPATQPSTPPAAVVVTPEPNLPVVHVTGVRIRGWDAQVDVVRPAATGEQLVTVTLNYVPVSGWVTRHVRVWRGPVSELLTTTRIPPPRTP